MNEDGFEWDDAKAIINLKKPSLSQRFINGKP